MAFGTGGVVLLSLPSKDVHCYAAAVDSAGRLVVAGAVDQAFAIARLHDDGSLDAGFGANGVTVLPKRGFNYDQFTALGFAADGAILAAGSPVYGHEFDLVRFQVPSLGGGTTSGSTTSGATTTGATTAGTTSGATTAGTTTSGTTTGATTAGTTTTSGTSTSGASGSSSGSTTTGGGPGAAGGGTGSGCGLGSVGALALALAMLSRARRSPPAP